MGCTDIDVNKEPCRDFHDEMRILEGGFPIGGIIVSPQKVMAQPFRSLRRLRNRNGCAMTYRELKKNKMLGYEAAA